MFRRIAANLVLAAIFMVGLGMLLYPHVSFRLSHKEQMKVVQGYRDEIEELDEKTRSLELERAQAYNAKLKGAVLEDPFVAGSGKVMAADYLSILSITEEMGEINIPRIGVQIPFYHGTSDDVLLKGAGHLEGSALPVGGGGTHTVLTGHTGLNTSKMFTDLIELQIGDEFFFCVLGQTYAYRVDQIKVVEPDNLIDLKAVEDRELATLITCTPYGVNSHRLLVRGERIPYTEEEARLRIQEPGRVMDQETLLLAAGISALLFLLFLLVITQKRKKRH